MRGSDRKWLLTPVLVVLTALALVVPAVAMSTPDILAWERGNNADAWTKGGTLKVCVDSVPAGAPAGITDEVLSAAVTEAINEWNTAQVGFGGLTLETAGATKANCDIHIEWEKDRASWGTTHAKDSHDKDNHGYGQETVRVVSEIGDGINARGITRILKHELGHAEGLGHSADSDLMKSTAYSSTPGQGPSAADLNSIDPYTEPTDDDKAGKKDLWGTGQEESRSTTSGTATPVYEATEYEYTVQAATDCDPAACTDNVTDFTVEISDTAFEDAQLTAPPGWVTELIDGSLSSVGKPLDNVPRGRSLASFSTTPSLGIAPGGTAVFTITTYVSPGTVRTYTNSPSFDSDEAFVPGPRGSGGGIAEPIVLGSHSAAEASGSSSTRDYTAPIAAAATAGALAIAAGGWYVRRRLS